MGGLLLALAALVIVSVAIPNPGRDRVTVFAAASLTDVAGALERAFEAAYPDVDIVVTTGASSVLARRIVQGEPADLFLSDSPAWTDSLSARGLLRYPARSLVGNGLVVVGPAGTPFLAGPGGLLRFEKIALADPEDVPAGGYAKHALQQAGLWEAVAPRVVPVSDVREAVAAVRTGAAGAAVVYRSDVRGGADVRVVLDWPEALQPRIRYTIAIPRATRHPNRALEFIEFVRDGKRLGVWRRYGFTPLAEPVLP